MPHAGDASHSDSLEWVQFLDMGGLYFWNRRTRETARQPPAGVYVVWVGTMDEEGTTISGTRKHVSVHMSFLLSLLGEVLTASPGLYKNTGRAAYLSVTMQRHVPAVLRASWPIWTRRTVAVVCTRRVLLVTMHLALCSLPWLAGPECSAFLAGTDLKDSSSGMYKLVFLVFLHLALCCPRRTGKLDYLGDGVYFSSASCIWKSLVRAFA